MTQTIAIATVVIAAIGLWFMYQQTRSARQKLRAEAYPRRAAIFRCTKEFLARAWTGNYVYMPDLLAGFYQCKSEASFVFDQELADYLESLYDGVNHHFSLETKLEIEGESMSFEEKRVLQDRVYSSRYWLGQSNRNLEKHFARYLDMSALR